MIFSLQCFLKFANSVKMLPIVYINFVACMFHIDKSILMLHSSHLLIGSQMAFFIHVVTNMTEYIGYLTSHVSSTVFPPFQTHHQHHHLQMRWMKITEMTVYLHFIILFTGGYLNQIKLCVNFYLNI